MPASEDPEWIETQAVVVSCVYQFARINTLTLGVQTGQKFRIAFDYYAHGRLYSDVFQSPIAIPQDERIKLRYNPLQPSQNDRSGGAGQPGGGSLIAVGVAGSILLSLLWLLILRSCS